MVRDFLKSLIIHFYCNIYTEKEKRYLVLISISNIHYICWGTSTICSMTTVALSLFSVPSISLFKFVKWWWKYPLKQQTGGENTPLIKLKWGVLRASFTAVHRQTGRHFCFHKKQISSCVRHKNGTHLPWLKIIIRLHAFKLFPSFRRRHLQQTQDSLRYERM